MIVLGTASPLQTLMLQGTQSVGLRIRPAPKEAQLQELVSCIITFQGYFNTQKSQHPACSCTRKLATGVVKMVRCTIPAASLRTQPPMARIPQATTTFAHGTTSSVFRRDCFRVTRIPKMPTSTQFSSRKWAATATIHIQCTKCQSYLLQGTGSWIYQPEFVAQIGNRALVPYSSCDEATLKAGKRVNSYWSLQEHFDAERQG